MNKDFCQVKILMEGKKIEVKHRNYLQIKRRNNVEGNCYCKERNIAKEKSYHKKDKTIQQSDEPMSTECGIIKENFTNYWIVVDNKKWMMEQMQKQWRNFEKKISWMVGNPKMKSLE